MAVSRRRTHAAYGIGQPLYDLSPLPIKSTRAPTTADLAEIGTPWIRTSTKQTWVLTAIASNSATWTPTSVNAGATIDTGDLTLTTGDLMLTAGSIGAPLGEIKVGLDVTGRSLFADGDEGTGALGEVGFTNVSETTLSSGVGTILLKTANPGNSAGFLKVYVDTTPYYIPIFANISP
jgi:hypothetical protein